MKFKNDTNSEPYKTDIFGLVVNIIMTKYIPEVTGNFKTLNSFSKSEKKLIFLQKSLTITLFFYKQFFLSTGLTLLWQVSIWNQFIDLQSKSVEWFLYDRVLHHAGVNVAHILPDFSPSFAYLWFNIFFSQK